MAQKVMLGMSGGVDSSVAAVLLKEQGYEVIGVTLKLWDHPDAIGDEKTCCSLETIDDARAVANKLDIPYYVLNFKDVFERYVVDDFIDSYQRGETPNPCVRCNQFIKFDWMLKKARSMGIECVATGHYAKIGFQNGRYTLERSAGGIKDQTYFLYNLTQEQLSHTVFPLYQYTKDQVRAIAAAHQLPVAQKTESQEICFIPDNNYIRFLQERGLSPQTGEVVYRDGKVIAIHSGIYHYTIGQRKGLGIAWPHPLYVTGLDVGTNRVMVGKNEDLYKKECTARQVNLIAMEHLPDELIVEAKVRYGAKPAKAIVTPLSKDRVQVRFADPQRAITPGQSVVFYQGNLTIGGGIIENETKDTL